MLYRNPYKPRRQQPTAPAHAYSYPVAHPATVQRMPHVQTPIVQHEAVKAVRSENRTLVSIVAFFAIWMFIAVVFLVGYMFQYLF